MSKKRVNNQQIRPDEKPNSKEICSELSTILKKVAICPFMVPEGKDRETIYQGSKKLTFAERASLLINFHSYPGTVLIDAGGLLKAEIRIDDKHSKASENRPLAYIEFSDGYKSRVEIIDILESVRNDATLIGHPVILSAIEHWQNILVWEKYSKNDDVYSEGENVKEWDELFTRTFIKSARENLEAIGKAMLEAVRRQAIPKETALKLKIEDLKIEAKNTYLYIAWKRLAKENIEQTHALDERISQIQNYLKQIPADNQIWWVRDCPIEMQKYVPVDSTIRISTVIDFLYADGSKFVYKENCVTSSRPRWVVFRNTFIQWIFQKENSTIAKYQTIAKTQEVDARPYRTGLFALPVKTNMYRFMQNVLAKPLVKFCEPIEISTAKVNSIGFGDLIKQTRMKK
jgi:hypothetical protein